MSLCVSTYVCLHVSVSLCNCVSVSLTHEFYSSNRAVKVGTCVGATLGSPVQSKALERRKKVGAWGSHMGKHVPVSSGDPLILYPPSVVQYSWRGSTLSEHNAPQDTASTWQPPSALLDEGQETQTVEAKEAEPSCLPEPRPPSPCIPGTPRFWPALGCLRPHGIPPLGIFQQKTNRNANSCLPSSGLPYNESVTGAPAPTIFLSPGILEKSPSLCLTGNPGPCRHRVVPTHKRGWGPLKMVHPLSDRAGSTHTYAARTGAPP